MLKFILLALAAVWGVAFAQFPAAQNQYIGSRNLLNNPGFENGVRTSWTFSGNTSTVSAETVAPLKDKISLKAVASAQIISFRQYITTPTALGGSPAQIKFSAKNTAPNVLVCVGHNGAALTGDSNCVTLATDNIKRDYVIPTSFGASSTGFDVLSTSTTGTLVIDSVELGDRLDVSDVQQARLHGSVRSAATTNCAWTNTSASLVAFAADADCPVPTVSGSVAAPATKVPGFILKGEPGDYQVYARGSFQAVELNASNAQCSFAINDGSATGDPQRMGISAIATGVTQNIAFDGGFVFKYTKTTSTDVTIQIFSQLLSGDNCTVDSQTLTPLVFDVYYYPPANKIFSTDSLGWFIDANIGGANPDLGVANVSTYTEITNAGLDLVVNTAKGSQSAKILCSGTNPPTGTTCAAGSESVGISFVIPKSGQYEVCAAASVRVATGPSAGNAIESTLQLVETPINAQTILQQGEERGNNYLFSANANTQQAATYPAKNCSIFNFASSGEKAVRLMYEQQVTGTIAASLLLADRAASVGQRDIHFTVKPAINLERINGSFAQIEDSLKTIPNQNYVINGNFDFWQRGTSLAAGTGARFLADRFFTSGVGTTVAPSRQSFSLGQVDVPNNPRFFHRSVVSSSAGAGNLAIQAHKIEDVTKLSGKTVTISFWAKAATSQSIGFDVEQSFGTGGSPSAAVSAIGVKVFPLTTSWQKFTNTFTLPSVSGKTLGTDGNSSTALVFWFDCGSSFASRCGSIGQQSGTFDIAQVKLEEGINATPFVLAGGTIAGELEACQRFYEKNYNVEVSPGTSTSAGMFVFGGSSGGSGTLDMPIIYHTKKRATPSSIQLYTSTGVVGSWTYRRSGVGDTNIASSVFQSGQTGFTAAVPVGASWVTANAYGFWTADAEL